MKLLLILSALCASACGYHVLVIFTVPSRSHSTLAKGIVDSLLDAGHQVTWASPFTDWKPHKSLKVIDVSETLELAKGIDMTQRADEGISFVKEFGVNITTVTNQNKQLREALVKQQFDAVVTEWFFSDSDAGYAAVQQAPWIMLNGMTLIPHTEGLIDDVRSISTVPIMLHDFTCPMSFWERIVNTATFAGMWIGMQLDTSSTTARYETQFGPLAAARGLSLPPFQEALHNISILLVNSHESIAPALSLPPNVLNIAGYHINDAQPLPKDIQDIMDSASCVVYFSMGSVVKSAELPLQLRKQLIETFEGLPCLVFWKFEEELQLKSKSNVVVRKWWPQASVLAHPKVKLFITHSGGLSTIEAVHYGVPLLAVPVFGDQPSNAARAVRAGYATKVPYSDDMAPQLKAALDEMLNNDRYYKQAKFLSKMFNNRPVHPRKLIAHYIQLAIESKGAYHLRSKAKLYSWYQRWMLDQIAALLVLLYAFYASAKRILCIGVKKEKKVKKN